MTRLLFRSPRGAALILAMLVMLVLSGLGLIALSSVTDSVWQSSSYRARAQGQLFSDGVLNFGVFNAGLSAPEELAKVAHMTRTSMLEAGADQDARVSALNRGGYHIYTTNPADDAFQTNLSLLFPEGRFFEREVDPANAPKSFENAIGPDGETIPVAFRYIIRDPLEGPSVPGFSGKFCFKKVSMASQARVGDMGDGSSRSSVALGSHLAETLLGPVDCLSQ
ncbi:MAG: hypothetical protein ACNA8W_03135 [Bradymonadaceae bacterium]